MDHDVFIQTLMNAIIEAKIDGVSYITVDTKFASVTFQLTYIESDVVLERFNKTDFNIKSHVLDMSNGMKLDSTTLIDDIQFYLLSTISVLIANSYKGSYER